MSAFLNSGEINQPYLTDDCPFCGFTDTSAQVGGPINTSNGNYTYRQSTPAIRTVGSPLQFSWTYNSLNSGIDSDFPLLSSTLGAGWTHNYQMYLDLSLVDSPKQAAVVRAPHGTPIYFERVRDHFEPAPGVHATMTFTQIAANQHIYTVTTGSQATYVFTEMGNLWRKIDAQGNTTYLLYNSKGQLQRVEEPVSGRFLEFTYNDDGSLISVSDPINRSTQFGYTDGRLTTITDTRGYVWEYDYTLMSSGEYLLSHVIDPDGRTVEQTTFDDFGRAISQLFKGQNLSIAYHDDGRRVITDGLGYERIHVYNKQNLLVAKADPGRELERFVLDENHNRTSKEDRNGNATLTDKTSFGYTTAITDALGNASHYEYDSRNNPSSWIDSRGKVTLYGYDAQSNLITQTNHLGDSMSYTYNERGQMTSFTDENNVTTQYGYDALGQATVMTDHLGHTTSFAVDEIGRVITSTDFFGRVKVNQYDEADNLIQVIENYLPGKGQNYQNQYNLITQYGYDGAGNQIAMTDTAGSVNLNIYDEAGYLVKEVINYDRSTPIDSLCTDFSNPDPEYNICALTEYDELGRVVATTDSLGRINRSFFNELGRVVGTIDNSSGTISDTADLPDCLSLPLMRDEDICTLHQYDPAGNAVIMTDTVGNMTRTFYDQLNRIDGMIFNWDGQTTLADCATLPAERDENICTLFGHDEAGNTIVMTDTLGRMSRTFLDDLGRTEAMVLNWNPTTLNSPDECILHPTGMISPDNNKEENICTLTEYDAAGNQTVMTNALGQRTLTVYDSLNRPFISVANWDGTPITSESDCSFPPAQPDTNLCSVTYYDDLGRPHATKDGQGKLIEMGYDSAGRLVTTTRYLDDLPVQTVTSYDANGNPLSQTDALEHTTRFTYDSLKRKIATISAEGTVITTTYDAAGRAISTLNNLGHQTTMSYDKLDRLIAIRDTEGHVTRYESDVQGNQVAVIDALGVRTSYEYDKLNRLVRVIENDTDGPQTNNSNLVTEYTLDALGNQLSIVNARQMTSTHTTYDALNRAIVTSDALGHQTQQEYNALGMSTVITDANGEVMRLSYDGLNRPLSITYVADNQVVRYAYNAVGQPTVMTDSLGTTTYSYNDLSRLTEVTDTFGHTVIYGYDLIGNRTSLTYPDGKSVTYTYDADHRLRQVTDWNLDVTTYDYDDIGRLITTTLSNGVTAIKQYDDTNRLTNLRYVASDDSLLAEYNYQLDAVGNRQAVTETLLTPESVSTVEAFIESDGLLVIEAENGQETASTEPHEWLLQTAQSGYGGEGYLRAMPDIGAIYQLDELAQSPNQDYNIDITNPDDYTVWVRGQAPDAASDSMHVGLNGQVAQEATRLTGFDQEWGWSKLTMDQTSSFLPLDDGISTLDIWAREDGLRVDRLLLTNDPNYVPTGIGPPESPYEATMASSVLTSHVIDYTYDDLYRLREAVYSGAITAAYQYAYDGVGNMTAYTETVDTETTYVERTFDAANRLESSFDDNSGTTNYQYDENGNLITIMPEDAPWQHYSYDQRDLMTSSSLSTAGTGEQPVTSFTYDGARNRMQQVSYTDGTATTSTYTNGSVGLAQVLVADDGNNQIDNLFGLDLISQDDGTDIRYLLTDGLGTVRTEMLSQTIESITTYDPYGNLLVQTGNSGTTYGYTGEQQDSATGLLYLRARYYNPALRTFMGPDAWAGNMQKPQSMNGWSYVENNPVNLTDPTGLFPNHCENRWTLFTYVWCVTDHYNIATDEAKVLLYQITGSSGDEDFDKAMRNIRITRGNIGATNPIANECYSGPVPYRADGYLEGMSYDTSAFPFFFQTLGEDVVYDFATFERGHFENDGMYATDTAIGAGGAIYAGRVLGFRSWTDVSEYGGFAYAWTLGAGANNFLGDIPIGGGVGGFRGIEDPTIRGSTLYVGGSLGAFDYIPFWEFTVDIVHSQYIDKISYVTPLYTGAKGLCVNCLLHDISTHAYTPWGVGYMPEWFQQNGPWRSGLILAERFAWVYTDMHRMSRLDGGY